MVTVQFMITPHVGQILESESLFTYPSGQTFADYANDNVWMPQFIDEVVSGASEEIRQTCNNDQQCIFDFSQTGDPDIGMGTLATNMNNSMDSMIASKLLYCWLVILYNIVSCCCNFPDL